ncbi:ATP-binding cassette domain-containing protein [Periweissella fabaria]|uniref:ABC transporter ATP-binding protein YbiT n=1 Tax=Periweissella fabaria TaxID=546157 RepID=A0ABM8Z610_9LACO|nr:ATP-binding cassette domain-containing protein [Periweissella fabaria]MCM0598053.1 ATP-binding cassette domain-containing protein [Periweissella fabaria]CAH0416671.1 putative ABC transporter ATP-binding protein YbiT [Periweissella fabaria]
MLTVSNVSVSFSGRKLYDEVNLKFTAGNTYGVIGANGAGKSTFLKVLEGKLSPTTGNVSMGANERMSSLNQDHFAFDEFEVLDTVIQGHQHLYDVMKEKDAIYMKEDFTDADGIRAGELEAEFAEMGGWESESEASQLLQQIGIPEDMHNKKMAELTESEKVKVLLAQALFGSPDILVLDEPTNGLDTHTVTWLENFLADYPNIVIVVSHDRHFLNAVATMMLDVDFGKIKLFVGNYDFWKQSSELAARLQSNANAKKEEKIKELQEFVARFSANASKAKQATSRQKQLEKITLDDIQPSTRKYPWIKFEMTREVGNDLLRVDNVSKTIDGVKILDNITFVAKPGEKVALLSRSDVATTTLMQILAGELEPDSGTVTWGVTTQRSYMSKDINDNFDDPKAVIIDWLRQFASKEESDNTFLRGMLGRMLFSGDDVTKEINVLSGGEKVRVMLSKLMLLKTNVLLMDDPTNHLDLESITSLNEGMIDYKGSIIFTSHDREFIQTIADHIIEVSDKGIVERAETTYDEFVGHDEVQKQVEALYN